MLISRRERGTYKVCSSIHPNVFYVMFQIAMGLCEHINGVIRKFWWGSKDGQRKTAWVSWKTMSKPKFMGGLGFRDVELFNLALLAPSMEVTTGSGVAQCSRFKSQVLPRLPPFGCHLGCRSVPGLALHTRGKRCSSTRAHQTHWLWNTYEHMARQLAAEGLQTQTNMLTVGQPASSGLGFD